MKVISLTITIIFIFSVVNLMPVYGESSIENLSLYLATTQVEAAAFKYAEAAISELLQSFVGNENLYG